MALHFSIYGEMLRVIMTGVETAVVTEHDRMPVTHAARELVVN